MYKEFRNKITTFFLLLFFLMAGNSHAQIPVGEDTTPIYDAIYFDSLSRFSHDEIQVRTVSDSTIQRLKRDDDFWYADLAPEKNQGNQRDNGPVLVPGWLKTLVWTVIIISMIAVVIWFLLSSNIRFFRKPSAIVSSDEEETFTEDIFAVDFEREIKKAVESKNYRQAIRMFYLRTLRDLSHLSLIDYKHERTNSEYLAQLAGTNYYRPFFQLTRDFEYVWYGQFDLSFEAFQQVKDDFSKFKEGLAA
jgi:hypothetical protein